MNLLYPLILVLLAVFAVAPLEYPGAFQSQTGLLAVYRLIQLDSNPLQFFHWAPTFGQAFDLFRTEGTLPYFVAEIVHLVGFGFLDSIKLAYALAWVASGLTMYGLVRRLLSDESALLAAAVYIYLPFHIAAVYLRGDLAESFAWALFPLALHALLRWQGSNAGGRLFGLLSRQGIVCIAAYAALFLTQPGLAILFAIFSSAVALALFRHVASLWRLLRPAVAGLGVGLLIDLPAIFDHGARIDPHGFVATFVLPFELLSAAWPLTAKPGTPSQPEIIVASSSFALGVVPLSLAIVALALVWRSKERTPRRLVLVSLTGTAILALLTFPVSAPLWSLLGALVTHPSVLLVMASLALSMASGAVPSLESRFARPAMLAFLVALPVVSSYSYLTPEYIDFTPTRAQIGVFNNEIALLDYRIVGPLRHGATIRLQTQWQALREINHDYTFFVHAVDDRGKTWGQLDAKPLEGKLPTLKWKPGQVIFDTLTIQIDVEGPPEGFHLEVGMYQSGNGERAFIETGASQLDLPRPGDPDPTISDQMPVTQKP